MARRIHAELTLGHGLVVGHCAVELLMHRSGIAGVSGSRSSRRIPHVATAADLVERRFRSDDPDRLWVTDITEHPTRVRISPVLAHLFHSIWPGHFTDLAHLMRTSPTAS